MWKGEKMISGELKKKIAAFSITTSLIVLIFLVLTPPPITAVYLHPGTPNSHLCRYSINRHLQQRQPHD